MKNEFTVVIRQEGMPDKRYYMPAPVASMVERLGEFNKTHPLALEPEFLDFLLVVSSGAKKYPPGRNGPNWLQPDGKTCSHHDMHDKIFHHVARSFTDATREDHESGYDHLLHVACRALMRYTLIKRGVIHIDDIKSPLLEQKQ